MPIIFEYLLKLSITLMVVYAFYQLVLRRLTFYNWNRWYLLGYSILAFGMATVDITPLLQQHELGQSRVLAYIPSVESYTAQLQPVSSCPEPVMFSNWTKWDWILLLLGIGGIILLIRLGVSLFAIYSIRRQATRVAQDNMNIYLVDKPIMPFSFGTGIYINQAQHSATELQDIIRHEFVHVRQQHTTDLMVGEILCILNWYNPFAWLLRKAIRQNLEFIADQQVLDGGIDRKQYQYLLLKVMGNKNFSIANNFNFSSLKKRIAMMNKMQSAKRHLLRFFFLLPLLTVLLLAFRSGLNKPGVGHMQVAGLTLDALTNQPLGGVTVTDERTGQTVISDSRGYYSFTLPEGHTVDQVNLRFTLAGWHHVQLSELKTIKEPAQGLVALGYLQAGNQPALMWGVYEIMVDRQPNYEMAVSLWKQLHIDASREQKLRKVMELSKVPVAVVDGIPCVVSANGAVAWLAGFDRLSEVDFKVKLGNRLLTMEEANKAIARVDVKTVGSAAREYSRQHFGYDGSLLLINVAGNNMESTAIADTIIAPSGSRTPAPSAEEKDFIRRHPRIDYISWGYMSDVTISGNDAEAQKLRSALKSGDVFMIIYFKNGKWDHYNVSNEESVRKFIKAYGEKPPRAPAPSPDTPANLASKPLSTPSRSKTPGFRVLAADSLIWSSDRNTLTLMGNAMTMDEATETVLRSDAIVLRQPNMEKVFIDGKSLAADDLHVNSQRYTLHMQTLTAAEATRRYGTEFTGTVLEITTEKVEEKR